MQVLKPLGLALVLSLSMVTAQAEVTHINNDRTSELLADDIPLIDVRMKSEWEQTGIVEGSHLLTFFDEKGRYDVKQWVSDLEKIVGKDKPFMLICAVGGRTGNISQFLDQKLGFSKVHNVERGIVHWIQSDKPVITYADSLLKAGVSANAETSTNTSGDSKASSAAN